MRPGLKIISMGSSCFALGILLSLAAFLCWVTAYPEDYDPKNIDYVLWKHGLNQNMNLDHAVGGMTHDTWAVRLVSGLTVDQLKSRFGFVRTLSEARPYDQLCYTQGGAIGEAGVRADGKEVRFLRNSDWMVILDQGKAVDLILCKGY
jgi:hypothetical protein